MTSKNFDTISAEMARLYNAYNAGDVTADEYFDGLTKAAIAFDRKRPWYKRLLDFLIN